jgi:hypothetical protein
MATLVMSLTLEPICTTVEGPKKRGACLVGRAVALEQHDLVSPGHQHIAVEAPALSGAGHRIESLAQLAANHRWLLSAERHGGEGREQQEEEEG